MRTLALAIVAASFLTACDTVGDSDAVEPQLSTHSIPLPASVAIAEVKTGIQFNSVVTPSAIPGSKGATFCALTMVDDDAPTSYCRIFFHDDTDNAKDEWRYQTGHARGQTCEATCIWLK